MRLTLRHAHRQRIVARELGVHHATVEAVRTDSMLMIAKALDVPVSEIAPELADRLRGVAI